MDQDYEFVTDFNEWYPFERYIIRQPKPISDTFDDIVLTEVFVKDTEIRRLYDKDGRYRGCTQVKDDDVCVKVLINGVEARLAFYDFSESVREIIRMIFFDDFGGYEWQSLYVDYENEDGEEEFGSYEELRELLSEQKRLITEKYGECNVKKHFNKDDIMSRILEEN